MKERLIVLILILLVIPPLFAQQTFEKIISHHEDQVISSVVGDEEGNFLLAGSISTIDLQLQSGYIVKLDEFGNILQELTIRQNDASSCCFFNIHHINQYYYLLGAVSIDSVNDKLWYVKLNCDLEIEKEQLLNTVDERVFSAMNSILDSDSNFVLTGYTQRIEINHMGNPIFNYDPFFYKVNLEGDSMKAKFLTYTHPLSVIYDIIESKDSSRYFAFGWKFTDVFSTSSVMLTLNKELDSIDIDSIPLGIMLYYSPTYINETDMLIYGVGASEVYALNALSITEQAEMINYNHFKMEGSMRDYPSLQNGISVNNDNIYIGGTSNFDYHTPHYSANDSWFHLIKINEDITPQWEYWYGGDAYYSTYSILATDDGGCLMVGNRYDYEAQYLVRDIYIVKVNSEGLITSIPEHLGIEMQEAIVYPNPGNEVIKVRIAIQYPQSTFELFDMNGQFVLRENFLGTDGVVNTTFLPQGTYLYKITSTDGLNESGKWVKR